jgi:hypothetical protein
MLLLLLQLLHRGFVVQKLPLAEPEALLLIDDGEGEPVVADSFLEHRMRADNDGCIAVAVAHTCVCVSECVCE